MNTVKKYKLLLIDDESAWSNNLKDELERLNLEVAYEERAENTLLRILKVNPDAVLLDILFNGENKGKPTFDKIKAHPEYSSLPVIILTSTMVDTYNDDDYPGRAFPYPKDSLRPEDEQTYRSFAERIRKVIEKKDDVESYIDKFGFVVGKTKAMRDVCRIILKASESNSYILITGEEGTGKEHIAKAIHNFSMRSDRPFIPINCGALPDTLIESELFGVCSSIATQVGEREGRFEQADKGTLFLDEIGAMPVHHQAKLMRALDSKRISRVGSTRSCRCRNKKHPDHTDIELDVRVIAATNIDIATAIAGGQFKKDLYDRLNVIHIHMPPLRERKEDIEELYQYLVKKLNKELGKEILETVRPDIKRMLDNYDWPGNIRELSTSIERAMNVAESTILLGKDFPPQIRGAKKNNELRLEPSKIEKLVERVMKGELTFKDIVEQIAPMGSPTLQDILEGICHRCYKDNGNLTEDLLVPILNLNTRGNIHRVLADNGVSTKELKRQFKNRKQATEV